MREPASTIPAPDEHSASPVLAQDEHQSGPPLTLNPLTLTGSAVDIAVPEADRPPRTLRKKLTDEQRATLHRDFSQLDNIDERIAYALSHKASKAWTDEYLGLRNWLRNDNGRQAGNGRHEAPLGSDPELQRLRALGVIAG